MSLSKVFKDSRGFQPEEILPRPAGGGSGWSGSELPDRPDLPFRESSLGKKRSTAQGFTLDKHLAPPQQSPPLSQDHPNTISDTGGAAVADQPVEHPKLQEPEAEKIHGIDPRIVEKMVEESFQRGIEEGMKLAEADFGSALQSMLGLCRQLDNLRETILANSIDEMQDLVLAIAEKIIRVSVRDQDNTIIETVYEAIHSAVRSDEFYVYVNPDDLAVIQEKTPDFIAGLNGLNNLVVKKDQAIERGGCKVESENCTVDATIASQFEVIREQIKKRLKQA